MKLLYSLDSKPGSCFQINRRSHQRTCALETHYTRDLASRELAFNRGLPSTIQYETVYKCINLMEFRSLDIMSECITSLEATCRLDNNEASMQLYSKTMSELSYSQCTSGRFLCLLYEARSIMYDWKRAALASQCQRYVSGLQSIWYDHVHFAVLWRSVQ